MSVWRGVLPWAVPALAALLLWTANSFPDLSGWRLRVAEQSECGASLSDWQSDELRKRSSCHLYRVALTLGSSDLSDQALLISKMARDARVNINGQVVREPDPSPATSYAIFPELVLLPAGELHAGENEVLIQLRSGTGVFELYYLGASYLGPRSVLAPAWQRSLAVGRRGAQLALVISFAITVFLLPVAWVRRQESLYRWFALTLVSSSIYILNFALAWRPLSLVIWNVLVHAALALSLWTLIKFSHRFVGLEQARQERAFGWLVLAGVGSFAVSRLPGFKLLGWFELVYRFTQIALLAYLAMFWWRQRQRDTWPRPTWFAGGVALIMTLGIIDSFTVFGMVGQPLTSYTLHWGVIYLLVLLFAALVMRIARALGDAERAQQRLALALTERTSELETEFALRREAQQARTLAEERHRIMRDMHDGVGGQLVALIGQAQGENLTADELEWQLRRTLDDLRLMIDSLDAACADLSVALGMLRQRLDAAFARLPVKIEWHTAHLPDLQPVSPTVVLNVMRIVQEAITNALKHADASTIRITANLFEGVLQLEISDDGRGFGPGAPVGRGLASMHERARVIGATLEIHPSPGGTRVALQLAQGRAA